MSKRRLGFVVAALLVVGGAVGGNLALRGAEADSGVITLTSFQETPALVTSGFGQAIVTIDDSSQTITFGLRWSGLTGPPLFAHIHIGQTGVAGGVSAFLCGGSTKPACPQATSGQIQGTIVPADVIGPSGQGVSAGEWSKLVQAIRSGNTYANMHTPQFPSGEIRGQISVH